jgi:hypothetical protein
VNRYIGANFPFIFLPQSYDEREKKHIKHDHPRHSKGVAKYTEQREGDWVASSHHLCAKKKEKRT